MKRKGTTVIEVIVVIGIIFILSSCFLGVKSIEKIRNDIAVKSIQADISNTLTLGKLYSNSNEVRTRVVISAEEQRIVLLGSSSDEKVNQISSINLPKGFSYLESQLINISEKGVINSTTISFRDKLDEIHEITIAVGTDIITIY